MNWYKKAQAINRCDRVLITPNPTFSSSANEKSIEYFYIGEDDRYYFVKDSCNLGDSGYDSWKKDKKFYSMRKI